MLSVSLKHTDLLQIYSTWKVCLSDYSHVFTSFFTVVMWGVKLGVIIGQLDTGNDQVILLVRCVSSQHQPVHTVVLPLWPGKKEKEKKKVVSLMPFQLIERLHVGIHMCQNYYEPDVWKSTWRRQAATEQWGWATLTRGSSPGHIGRECFSSRSCTPHLSPSPQPHHQMHLLREDRVMIGPEMNDWSTTSSVFIYFNHWKDVSIASIDWGWQLH